MARYIWTGFKLKRGGGYIYISHWASSCRALKKKTLTPFHWLMASHMPCLVHVNTGGARIFHPEFSEQAHRAASRPLGHAQGWWKGTTTTTTMAAALFCDFVDEARQCGEDDDDAGEVRCGGTSSAVLGWCTVWGRETMFSLRATEKSNTRGELLVPGWWQAWFYSFPLCSEPVHCWSSTGQYLSLNRLPHISPSPERKDETFCFF